MTDTKQHLLDMKDVSIVFGGLRAVSNVNLHIDTGELVGLIGPNGAGKTTAFNMITGVYTPTEGTIHFDGNLVNGKKSFQVTQMGMARTFQNIRLFADLSVLDNVKIAMNMHIKYNLPEAILRVKKYFQQEDEVTRRAMDLLKLFHLDGHADDLAKNLPYGAQRRLEIARALATEPKLLLLDEPAAGMNPQETKELMEMIRWIRDNFHIAILLMTRHGPRHGRLRTHLRIGIRLLHRLGHAGRNQEEQTGNQGLFGRGGIVKWQC